MRGWCMVLKIGNDVQVMTASKSIRASDRDMQGLIGQKIRLSQSLPQNLVRDSLQVGKRTLEAIAFF